MLFRLNVISVLKNMATAVSSRFHSPLAMGILIYLTKHNIRVGSCLAYCYEFYENSVKNARWIWRLGKCGRLESFLAVIVGLDFVLGSVFL